MANHFRRLYLSRLRVPERRDPNNFVAEKKCDGLEPDPDSGPDEAGKGERLKSKRMIGKEAVMIDKPHSATVQTTIRALS